MNSPMFPWHSACMLAYEAHEVIRLRFIKLTFGGAAACDEACLMVSEKFIAALEAGRTFAEGGTADAVISTYRTHVAANAARLGS